LGSIPLPALDIKPAQPVDALSEYAKVVSLRGMMQQQQIQQLDVQQKQQAIADQHASTTAMLGWDGKDPNELAQSTLKNGGSSNAAIGLQQHFLDVRAKAAGILKDNAESGQKILQTHNDRNDLILGHLKTIDGVSDADLPGHVLDTVEQMGKDGTIVDPGELNQYRQAAQNVANLAQQNPQQARQAFQIMEKRLQGEKEQNTQAIEERKTAAEEQKAKAAEWKDFPALGTMVNTRTGEQRQIGGAGQMSPAMQESKYLMEDMKRRQGQPYDKDFVNSYEKLKTLNTQFKFNLEAAGVGGNQPLTPNQQATKQAILEGRQSAPTGRALSSPYWQTVMGGVYQDDPQWNEQRAQLRKDFTVGKHSTEINAINTAMGHVGVLGDAIDALNNGDVKSLNAIGNRLGIEFGTKTGDATAMAKMIVHRVGPELSKAYVGAGGSAGERGADEADFNENLAPHILKNNVTGTVTLLRSKIGSLENQWNQNKSDSMPSFQDRFISPEAKSQLDKWSAQKQSTAGNAKVVPSGATHVGVGSSDKKKHYLDAKGKDLGVVPD
jgi:hypothetical protein